MVAQFAAEATNSEKSIYFLLLLISCSINKVSNAIRMLKFCVFRLYVKKKIFAPGNGGGLALSDPLPLSLRPCIKSCEKKTCFNDVNDVVLVFLLLTLIFHPFFSGVFIVDFEQVFVCWVGKRINSTLSN